VNYATLLSGLIGALLSAALGFGVRWCLDRRSLQLAEQRVAYVHLVSVSTVVAADTLARSYLKVVVGDMAKETFADPDGIFEPSHAISAFLYQELTKLTPERLNECSGASLIPRVLNGLVEGAKESKLSAEQLSKLPKQSVLVYTQYITYLSHVQHCLELWATLFETGDAKWLTAQFVHDNWLTVDRFCKQATLLRVALIEHGACTKVEAAALLHQQMKQLSETVLANLVHKPKIEAAVQSLRKSMGGGQAG
jgi:hypothetical protein